MEVALKLFFDSCMGCGSSQQSFMGCRSVDAGAIAFCAEAIVAYVVADLYE